MYCARERRDFFGSKVDRIEAIAKRKKREKKKGQKKKKQNPKLEFCFNQKEKKKTDSYPTSSYPNKQTPLEHGWKDSKTFTESENQIA